MSKPSARKLLAARYLLLLTLSLLVSGLAFSQTYTFTGRVLAGNPELGIPAEDIRIELVGDEDEWPENGPRTVLAETMTGQGGEFLLEWFVEGRGFPFFHVMVLTPPGMLPGGAEVGAPGYVRNLAVISYVDVPPGLYPGSLFWIAEESGRQFERPPEGVAELELLEFVVNRERLVEGEPFELFVVVLNAGPIPVEGVGVIIVSEGEGLVAEGVIEFLGPGEVGEVVIEQVARRPGEHLLTAIVDPENVIAEFDEGNNRALREVVVVAAGEAPPVVSPPRQVPSDARLPPGVPCEGSSSATCGDALSPATAVLGPVFMHSLERYFMGMPAESEMDQVIAAVMDANPEGQGLLQRALETYRALPEEVKLRLFDEEILGRTTTATTSLSLDLVRDRLAAVDPGLAFGSFAAPVAPSGLAAHNATTEDVEFRQFQIRLNWQDNAGDEDGFAIYRTFVSGAGTTVTAEPQLVKTVTADVSEYYDPLTAPAHQDDQYCYQVRAFKTNAIVPVGQLPQPIESDPTNTACSYFDPSQHPPPADFDNDGVPDKDDDCPGMPGSVLGCPDSDKDGVADPFDPCPLEWGEDLIAFDTGPQPANGCPFKYKLAWLGLEVLNNSVPFTDQFGTNHYYEGQDPYPATGPNGISYGEEEPFLLFNLVNGQSVSGKAESWTVRWCCGEHVSVAAGTNVEPDDDPSGEENPQSFNQLTTRGLPIFGELDKPAVIDTVSDLTMVVILMERDWTNEQCFKDSVSEWDIAISMGKAAGSAIGGCAGSFGAGCGLAIGNAVKSIVELLFSLDPDPVCVNVSDPDDYMGTDYWYVSRDSAQLLTSKNGSYGFWFDMPTTIIKVTTGWWSDEGPIYQTAGMRARLQFCLYREGVAESQVRTLCSPLSEVQVY